MASFIIATPFAAERLDAFPRDDRDHHERCDRVGPPPAGDGIEADAERVTGVVTDKGRLTADAYVGAMGSYTPLLVAPIGIRLPVYPIKGYSLTVPITDESVAPISTVMDETYKVATTRFDNRIRVGGTAEIAGWDMTLRPHRRGR